MTVIAFRPRRDATTGAPHGDATAITGTFRSPSGATGVMTGHLRLQRLVLAPHGVFVSGVFTGELWDSGGGLVGRGSTRATAPADLVRDSLGLHPVVRPLQLDLMGIAVRVDSFAIEPAQAFPSARAPMGQQSGRTPARSPGRSSR